MDVNKLNEIIASLEKLQTESYEYKKNELIKNINITENDLISCIELLMKSNTPLIQIQNFISLFEVSKKEYKIKNRELLDNNNVILLYIKLYNKLKYYENSRYFTDNLKYIESCLSKMFICDVENYKFYKNEIENQLMVILNLIPQTYGYEISEMKKNI